MRLLFFPNMFALSFSAAYLFPATVRFNLLTVTISIVCYFVFPWVIIVGFLASRCITISFHRRMLYMPAVRREYSCTRTLFAVPCFFTLFDLSIKCNCINNILSCHVPGTCAFHRGSVWPCYLLSRSSPSSTLPNHKFIRSTKDEANNNKNYSAAHK